jgi:hypothetical protein
MLRVGRPEAEPDGDVDAGEEEPPELDAGLDDELHAARTAHTATAPAKMRQERRLGLAPERLLSNLLRRCKELELAMSRTVGPFIA